MLFFQKTLLRNIWGRRKKCNKNITVTSGTIEEHKLTSTGCFYASWAESFIEKCGCSPLPNITGVCSCHPFGNCQLDDEFWRKTWKRQSRCLPPCESHTWDVTITYAKFDAAAAFKDVPDHLESEKRERRWSKNRNKSSNTYGRGYHSQNAYSGPGQYPEKTGWSKPSESVIKNQENSARQKNGNNMILLDIYYSRMEYTLLKEVEIYSVPSLISNVGGAVGLYLGASLMTFLQLFLYTVKWISLLIAKARKRRVQVRP